MVVLQKFLGVILKSCLFVDRFFLRAVDWVISSGVPMRFFSGRVRGMRSNISLRRGIIYSILAFFLGSGLYLCASPTENPPGENFNVPERIAGVTALSEDERVILSWTEATKATSYRVYKNSERLATEPTGTSYIDIDVENGVTYQYQISGVNTFGEGEKSETVEALPLPPKPLAPRISSRVISSETGGVANVKVKLSWNAIDDVAHYAIYRRTDGSQEEEIEDSVTAMDPTATTVEYIDTDITVGTTYYYRVKAVIVIRGHQVESEFSLQQEENPKIVDPKAPQGLSVTNHLGASPAVFLEWNPPSGGNVTGYEIYRGTSINDVSEAAADRRGAIAELRVSPQNYTDMDPALEYGRTYRYVVNSVVGGVRHSSVVSTITLLPDLQKPADLRIWSNGSSVFLTWKKVNNATHYELRRNAQSLSTVEATASTTISHTDGMGLVDDTLYSYEVRALFRTSSSGSNLVSGSYSDIKRIVFESDSSCTVPSELPGSLHVDANLEDSLDAMLATFPDIASKVKMLSYSFTTGGSDPRFSILYDIKNLGLGGDHIEVVDGPAGVVSPIVSLVNRATVFPAPILVTASWDRALSQKLGRAMARETLHNEKAILLAPGVNLYRVPTSGRNFEYHGEDPFLASQAAVNFVLGVQSENVVSTPKHYGCNNTEFERGSSSSNPDARSFHELYLPVYRAVLREAGAWSYMTALNFFHGTAASNSKLLNQTIMKDTFGFRGFLMSDWTGVRGTDALLAGTDLEMPNGSHFTKNKIEAEIRSGRLTEQRVDDAVKRLLRALVGVGVLEYNPTTQVLTQISKTVDFSGNHQLALEVARSGITLLKNESNVLPIENPSSPKKVLVIGNKSVVTDTARLGTGSANVQPANNPNLGTGKNNIKSEVTRLLGSSEFSNLSPNFITFDSKRSGGKTVAGSISATSLSAEQESKIRESDYVILALGYTAATGAGSILNNGSEGERKSRKFNLPEGQDSLVDLVKNVTEIDNTPAKLIVTITAGGGVKMNFADDVDAIVHSYYMGEAIQALPEVIFGRYNPSGKLPFTLEKSRRDTSTYPSHEGNQDSTIFFNQNVARRIQVAQDNTRVGENSPQTINNNGRSFGLRYDEGIFLGYRHFDRYIDSTTKATYLSSTKRPKFYTDSAARANSGSYVDNLKPLYYFGHGLSYSTFDYNDNSFTVSKTKSGIRCSDSLRVSVNVTNTGSKAGSEVVQLYMRDVTWNQSYPRPYKELKGYAKIHLEPQVTRRVVIDITVDAFAYYRASINSTNLTAGDWTIDPGEFDVILASSANPSDEKMRKRLMVTSYNNNNLSLTVDGEMIALQNASVSKTAQ